MEEILMKRTVELDTVEIADKLGELAAIVLCRVADQRLSTECR